MRVEHFWVGATSNSHYYKHKKIFEKQHQFTKTDLVNRLYMVFTNMLDKGYCVKLPAWKAGRQHVYQPRLARSNHKFSSQETIKYADITTN